MREERRWTEYLFCLMPWLYSSAHTDEKKAKPIIEDFMPSVNAEAARRLHEGEGREARKARILAYNEQLARLEARRAKANG